MLIPVLSLFQEVCSKGARKNNLEINAVGGASMKQNGKEDYFKIGQVILLLSENYYGIMDI